MTDLKLKRALRVECINPAGVVNHSARMTAKEEFAPASSQKLGHFVLDQQDSGNGNYWFEAVAWALAPRTAARNVWADAGASTLPVRAERAVTSGP